MAYGIQDPIDLARCLHGMSYNGLMSVARQLVDMNKPETGCARDLTAPQGMAELLADWAESEVLEAEERAAEAARKKASTQAAA